MNVTSFSVCKLALDALFQQIDRKYNLYIHISEGKNNSPFHKKNTNHDLESP